VKRGEVWWASLPDPVGAGPGFRRPVLVVQSNPFNESRIPTVVVAIMTSNLGLAEAPGNLRVSRSDSGLPRTSVVNVSQLVTVDKSVLTTRVRALPSPVMQHVEDGLRLLLGL
jgi:mRNA interferase MazF